MIEYRFCPQCGAPLTGKDFGKEGFHPWCEHCERSYIQPVQIQILALVLNREGRLLVDGNAHFPRFSVRYGEWLEDAFHRGFANLFAKDALYCEYLNSFWDEAEEALLVGMKACCADGTAPPSYAWRKREAGSAPPLSEIERQLLKMAE